MRIRERTRYQNHGQSDFRRVTSPWCRSSGRAACRSGRRGLATMWVILLIPVVLVLTALVLEIGNLWVARLELENSLESAALAAVEAWAEGSGSGTQFARFVGNDFANSNLAGGIPVNLADLDPDLNWDPAGGPNENANCPTGVLVFGAITSFDPVVFNASVAPGCGFGDLLLDASSGPNMQDESSWGINFRPAEDEDDPSRNLVVQRVVYDLRTADPCNNAIFQLDCNNGPTISRIRAGHGSIYKIGRPPNIFEIDETKGIDCSPLRFDGTFGPILRWSNDQVQFVFNRCTPYRLEVNFRSTDDDHDCDDDDDDDGGFEPGDRIRFGARVRHLGPIKPPGGGPNAEDDGDAVGLTAVRVIVTFARRDGTPIAPDLEGFFFDSNHGNPHNDPPPPDIDPTIPANVPFVLPKAPASGAKNDDQSYVRLGGLARPYAVRAQAQWAVPSLWNRFRGCATGPFSVSAKATAYYDCAAGRARLIRVEEENFLCN